MSRAAGMLLAVNERRCTERGQAILLAADWPVGIRASDGWLLPGDDGGFLGGDSADISNLALRWHWPHNSTFGYPLGASTVWDYFHWFIDPADGYQGQSYADTLTYLDKAMNLQIDMGDYLMSVGRLAKLRVGWRNFSGYHVALLQYDLPFDFSASPGFQGGGQCKWPRGDIVYEEQDWVEGEIVMSYAQREAMQAGDPDYYFPGADYDIANGYNAFQRYPPLDWYTDPGGWNDQLGLQWTRMRDAILGLGPQSVRLWNAIIEANGLADLGFEYVAGSSTLNAGSIVAYVEDYFGLTPPNP